MAFFKFVNGVRAPVLLTSVRVCLHKCGCYTHTLLSSPFPKIATKKQKKTTGPNRPRGSNFEKKKRKKIAMTPGPQDPHQNFGGLTPFTLGGVHTRTHTTSVPL